MCIRCLERLYTFHGSKIGAFPDVSILLRFMKTSSNTETRQRLLSFLAVLMGVNHDSSDHLYARRNLEQLLNRDAILQLCQLSSVCHDIDSNQVLPSKGTEINGASSAVLTSSQISKLVLHIILRLAIFHKSTNSKGIPFFPIPIAKRLICERPKVQEESEASLQNTPLEIICQGLLCREREIVHLTAEIMQSLMSHNDRACMKLYLTGMFFFAFTRNDPDWRPLAKLLEATHLKQEIFTNEVTNPDGIIDFPTERRSFLGDLLPDGLLKVLINHGGDKFAEVFVQEQFDTPEGKLRMF